MMKRIIPETEVRTRARFQDQPKCNVAVLETARERQVAQRVLADFCGKVGLDLTQTSYQPSLLHATDLLVRNTKAGLKQQEKNNWNDLCGIADVAIEEALNRETAPRGVAVKLAYYRRKDDPLGQVVFDAEQNWREFPIHAVPPGERFPISALRGLQAARLLDTDKAVVLYPDVSDAPPEEAFSKEAVEFALKNTAKTVAVAGTILSIGFLAYLFWPVATVVAAGAAVTSGDPIYAAPLRVPFNHDRESIAYYQFCRHA